MHKDLHPIMPDYAQELKRYSAAADNKKNRSGDRDRGPDLLNGRAMMTELRRRLEDDTRRIPEIAQDRGMGSDRFLIKLNAESG
jgi:hypothetical protein